jgi:predicted transcriptional regulator
MEDKKEFSLSYYFEELKQREIKQEQTKQGSREVSVEQTSTTTSVLVLKTLKEAQEQKMPLTALAKAVNLKLGPFEELVEHLEDEELIEIEADEKTGNDLIALTPKGRDLL